MSNDTEALMRRMEKLEHQIKQDRWIKLAGLVIFVGVLSMYFYGANTGQEVQEVIKAKTFCLVDENNQPRAILGFLKAGEPSLTFIDGNGQMGVLLGVSGGASRLTIYGEGLSADLTNTSTNGTMLRFYDKNNQPRAILGANSLGFYDENKTGRVALGFSGLGFCDARGNIIKGL